MRGGWGLFVLGSVIIFFDWLMYLLQLGVHWDILYQFRKNRRRSSYQTIKATLEESPYILRNIFPKSSPGAFEIES